MSDGKYFYRDVKTGEIIEITKEQFELIERMTMNKRKEDTK